MVWIAGLLGVVLGAGVLGLVWLLSPGSSEASDPGPEADAQAACAVIERADGLDPQEDFAGMRRWAAAGELAGAASEQDAQYKALADALAKPRRVANERFDGNHPDVQEAVSAAKQACASLAN